MTREPPTFHDERSIAAMRRLWKLTERYTGERFVYVEAETKAEALRLARLGEDIDADEPTHYDYRYSGPVVEVGEQ